MTAADGERVVYRTRARQTGTVVEVVDNRDGSFDSGEPERQPWFTVCRDHGGVCSHLTRAVAEGFASVPAEWCPTCQENAGTDHGTPAGADPPSDPSEAVRGPENAAERRRTAQLYYQDAKP